MTGEHRDLVTLLPDGRRIAYRDFGATGGQPLIALHGTPGSRSKFAVADAPARSLGIRMLAPDRWGYGGTDAHPSPSLSAFADDIARFADQLHLDHFAIMGVSGGGPYATAVASRLGSRVSALALVAPVGPISDVPSNELSAFHRFCFGPLGRAPTVVSVVFRGLGAMLSVSKRAGMEVAMLASPPPDRVVLATPGVRMRLAETFAMGLAPGTRGPVTDLALFGQAWDIDPGAVQAASRLWIGSADRNVPVAAALHLAARIPACTVEHLDGAGHLWVALNYPAVLSWVSEAAACVEP